MIGAALGFFVDMYDIYLPAVALTPALVYFQPNVLSPPVIATVANVVLTVTLIGRPIGAFVFGHFADKIGRKTTAMVAVGGFGLITLLMGLLPGYRQWGLAALGTLIVLRLLDGIFLGGEYTAASPLAMEYAPKEKRGLYGALIMAGFPLGYVAISIVTLVALRIAPLGGAGSPYVQWGWRIPFFVGVVISALFVLYYRSVPESELWLKSTHKEQQPIRALFRGDNLRHFAQVFVLMTGMWFTLNSVVGVLPALFGRVMGIPSGQVTSMLLVINLLLAGTYVGAGVWSQRIGRRTYLIWSGALTATVVAAFYVLLVGVAKQSVWLGIGVGILVELSAMSAWGLATTYVNERFQTNVRSSGFGLGYSLAVVIPSLYPFYMLMLGAVMPYAYTQVVLLALGGLLTAVGAALGPETRDVSFEP